MDLSEISAIVTEESAEIAKQRYATFTARVAAVSRLGDSGVVSDIDSLLLNINAVMWEYGLAPLLPLPKPEPESTPLDCVNRRIAVLTEDRNKGFFEGDEDDFRMRYRRLISERCAIINGRTVTRDGRRVNAKIRRRCDGKPR